jgi:hypothetical protein
LPADVYGDRTHLQPKERFTMDRRKTLATVGAISLTASAAFVALGSSMGLFGLNDTSSRVGKLSPIDTTQPERTETHTVYVDDPIPVPVPAAGGATTGSGSGSRSGYSTGTGVDAPQGPDANTSFSTPQSPTSTPALSAEDPAGAEHHDANELGNPHTGTGSPSAGHANDDD